LEPFTKILPKPLIPINDKPILQYIIDEFHHFGVNKFLMTLNYKGELIEAFMKHGTDRYEIDYVWEKDFFGTAGSLTR
jgi:NDP-sugar pyrophosphorylase family protein